MIIVICVDKFIGGAGNVAQLLARHFASRGDSVTILLDDLSIQKRYQLSNVSVKKRLSKKSNFIKNSFQTFQSIKRINPDIIISFLTYINREVLFSQLFSKTPVIVSERSNPYQTPPTFKGKLLRDICYIRASLITVQFEYFKGFSRFADHRKYVVTPNMILKSNHICKNYFSNIQNTISFVTLASKTPSKRIDLMIKIFKEINLKNPNTNLYIYGSVSTEPSIIKLIDDLKLNQKIILVNHISNVHEALSKHDIYLMTSSREGFPNSLSEAMSTGLPSVSFKCHDGLEELILNGQNGFLVDEENVDAFIRTSLSLVKNPLLRKEIGLKAIESTKKYNSNKVFEIWDDLIKHLNIKKLL
ncbi:MAG TPA: glycosyltransferase family 4 protein [Gallicola sp.]|nr:glycosyltransferase family 4 protein [Gallicola sp.]